MELNIKTIATGITLFILGGFSVYLITRSTAEPEPSHIHTMATPAEVPTTSPASETEAASTNDTESFYEAAEARREQQLANKAESDRLAKLTAIKERSVECQFWKQQQKTSSAAAKVEEKIMQHCTIQASSSANSESASSESGNSATAPGITAAESP